MVMYKITNKKYKYAIHYILNKNKAESENSWNLQRLNSTDKILLILRVIWAKWSLHIHLN